MKYCANCGNEVNVGADVCLSCGKSLRSSQQATHSDDTGSIGWGILGFCIPIVGLILFLVWHKDKPLNSKAAGVGALIGFIIGFISLLAI